MQITFTAKNRKNQQNNEEDDGQTTLPVTNTNKDRSYQLPTSPNKDTTSHFHHRQHNRSKGRTKASASTNLLDFLHSGGPFGWFALASLRKSMSEGAEVGEREEQRRCKETEGMGSSKMLKAVWQQSLFIFDWRQIHIIIPRISCILWGQIYVSITKRSFNRSNLIHCPINVQLTDGNKRVACVLPFQFWSETNFDLGIGGNSFILTYSLQRYTNTLPTSKMLQ